MADKQPATAPDPKATPATTPAKKSRKAPIIIVGALMLVEGVGIFFATKLFTGSSPATADAAHTVDGGHGEGHSEGEHSDGGDHGDGAKGAPAESEFGEITVSECRPTNRESGRLITFRMRVSVLVSTADLERTKTLIEANKARIDDRINFVMRSADPTHLHEPTLATIKRRLKAEFDRLLGDEHLIEEILIPEMLASAPGL